MPLKRYSTDAAAASRILARNRKLMQKAMRTAAMAEKIQPRPSHMHNANTTAVMPNLTAEYLRNATFQF